MASAMAKTVHPKVDPSVEMAKRQAKGTGLMTMVENSAPGLAARLF
jgi:hypothetical protein